MSNRPTRRVTEVNALDLLVNRAPTSVYQSTLCPDLPESSQGGFKLTWSPVFRCVVSGNTTALKMLLEEGADPNIPNDSGETPLHQAVESADYIVAKILLKNKANPDLQEKDGETSLHYAVSNQDCDMTELLLKFKANPNIAETRFARTPLHLAALKKHQELIRLLLLHGANPHIPDSFGRSPAMFIEEPDTNCGSSLFDFQAHDLSAIGKVDKTESSGRSALDYSEPTGKLTRVDVQHGKLFYWLQRLHLQQYYNLLVLNHYDNLDELSMKMRSPVPVTTHELEKLGIEKPAHRYNLLINLDIEAGIAPPITVKKPIAVDDAWCVDCRSGAVSTLLNLETWLELGGLMDVFPNLSEGGYTLEMILFQGQSDYRFTHSILLSELHITDRVTRNTLLRLIRDTVTQSTNLRIRDSSCAKCLIF